MLMKGLIIYKYGDTVTRGEPHSKSESIKSNKRNIDVVYLCRWEPPLASIELSTLPETKTPSFRKGSPYPKLKIYLLVILFHYDGHQNP